MGIEYVPVVLYVKDGKKKPIKFKSIKYDMWVTVLDVTETPSRKVSLLAGSIGIRYTCLVKYDETKREIYLYDEGNDNWFIEDPEETFNLSDDMTQDKQYEDCLKCRQKIIDEPLLEKHQGRVSYLCPHCRNQRGGWRDSKEDARKAWNEKNKTNI